MPNDAQPSESQSSEKQPRRREITLSPEEQTEFVRATRKTSLATIDKDGFPHLVAMTVGVKDGVYYMTSYAKAQKVVNIRRDPKVALMIEAGGSYAELKGVMVRGHCEVIEGADAVRDAWAIIAGVDNQPRRRETNDSAPKRVVLKVTPEKTYSWDHTKLGGRY